MKTKTVQKRPFRSTKTKTTAHSKVKRRVKLAVVPTKANQYRPHLVRRYGILVILVAVLSVQVVYNFVTGGSVMGAEAQVTPAGLLEQTNQARAEYQEPPLKINAELTKAAQQKAQNMFDEQYWAHTAPDGKAPWYWFGQVDYNYENAGENLAKNFMTDGSTVAAWMDSPSHRANILKESYQDVGFAVKEGTLDGQPTTLIVAMYGTPSTGAVQGATVATAPPQEASLMDQPVSFMSRLGLGLQSMTPAAVASVAVLILSANIALVAHVYRRKLPRALRESWYRHHGAYKAIGLISIAIVLVLAYGSIGQI